MSNDKFILGTAQFGMAYGISNSSGKLSSKEIEKIRIYCLENGIYDLDTADMYGDACEVLKASGFNDKHFRIHSKFILENKNESFDLKIQKSLSRLGTDCLETYSFHRFSDLDTSNIESIRKKNGYRNLGVSVYKNEDIERVIDLNLFDTIQIPFNLLDNNKLRGSYLIRAKESGLKVQVRSIFLQGLFFLGPEQFPLYLLPIKSAVFKLNEISSKYKISITELCIRYVLSFDYIDKILVGIDTLEQLKDNAGFFSKGPLSKSIINEIENVRVDHNELLNPTNWRPVL